MPKYIVKDGHQMGHQGVVVSAGDVIELSEDVAADGAVGPHIEPYRPPVVLPKPVRVAPAPVVVDSKTS